MLKKHPAYSILDSKLAARHVAVARQAHSTQQLNTLLLRPPAARIGCGEILFHLNSAVMMPDGLEIPEWPTRPHKTSTGDTLDAVKRHLPHEWRLLNTFAHEPGEHSQPRRGALGVLVAALAFLREHENYRLLVAGHTDTTGHEDANHALSVLRAEGVVALLAGDRKRWAEVAATRSVVADYQRILEYVACSRGFRCRPDAINNVPDESTRRAIADFKASYNEAYGDSLDGETVDGPTWAAFFDIYREDMARMLDIEFDMLSSYVPLRYLDPTRRWLACGEKLPEEATGDGVSASNNRRVELLFFHTSELPSLRCHPGDACLAQTSLERCAVYAPARYSFIQLEPTLEPGLSLKDLDGTLEINERTRVLAETSELLVVHIDNANGSNDPIAWDFIEAFSATFPAADFYDTPAPYEDGETVGYEEAQ